jgi:hypothetical protein
MCAHLPPAVWLDQNLSLSQRLRKSCLAVLTEILKGFQYIAWLPALLGLWWEGRRLRSLPESWLFVFLVLFHCLILWRLAMVAGYVSERHVVLVVTCGLCPAVAGLRELPRRLLAWWTGRVAPSWCPRLLVNAPAWSVVLVLVLVGMGLSKTLQPLHGHRAGHHAAGLWLAKHAGPDDEVCDSHFGWAKYYAGRLFLPPRNAPRDPALPATCYVVKGYSRERPRLYGPTNAFADMTEQQLRAAGGRLVYHWPERYPVNRAKVVVWAVRLPLQKPN